MTWLICTRSVTDLCARCVSSATVHLTAFEQLARTIVIFVSLSLVLIAGLLSTPVLVLFVEVIAALRTPVRVPRQNAATSISVAIIIPAHNESAGIIPTIDDIKPQLRDGDRLVVIADNCSDDTAEVAAANGADVVRRDNPDRIGKGYALACGVQHVSFSPPDIVIFFDADCRIESDVIAGLKSVCREVGRPVQACFLMKTAPHSPIDHSFSEFSFLVRNWVRPVGLSNLRGPAQLMGTGMAFPWDLIQSAPLANGNLVEDLKLGLDLAATGKAPYFYPFAKVTSEFPVTAKGTDSQRQRWEQGHIGTILKSVPQLIVLAITRRNLDLFVLTLDLLIPPLTLLGALVIGSLILNLLGAAMGGSVVGLAVAVANVSVFFLCVWLAWWKFGHTVLPARRLLSVVPLLLKKLRLYVRMLAGRTVTQWVRTDRSKK